VIARRDFLKQAGMAAAAQSALQPTGADTIVINPQPLFPISPLLYMQFMEPLGVTDSSVEAAWDYDTDDWRADFISVVQDLAPDVMRFGGLFSRYYRWREGVGPVSARPSMRNYAWGGKETNRVGTHEFVDFCRRVGAEPLYCVNFLSDGEKRYGPLQRTAGAQEAADWVSYANDPDNRERRGNGVAEPYNIKRWQIGNETSYGGSGTFSRDESIAHTIEFARAMKQRDPSIHLIGWGDRGRTGELWAPELLKQTGDLLSLVAIHMMGQSPKRPDSVLKGNLYQTQPERAWQELLELSGNIERRVSELESAIADHAPATGIAITEGHLSLSPHNANPILTEWLSAAYHARSWNIYQRHGARVRIATAADFQGTRWTVNAVMLPVPRGRSYLNPVGSIARLFKKVNGKEAVAVAAQPGGLDIAASRGGTKVYLHVANLEMTRSIEASFAAAGSTITGGRVFEIAPPDIRTAVNADQPDVFRPQEKPLTPGPVLKWRFPAASVSAVELDLA
jgi:alpha-L-arabinofuranosidase